MIRRFTPQMADLVNAEIDEHLEPVFARLDERYTAIEAGLNEVTELLRTGRTPRDVNIARLRRLRFRILRGGLEKTLVASKLRGPRPGRRQVIDGKSVVVRDLWEDGTQLSNVGRDIRPGLYSWGGLSDACLNASRLAVRRGEDFLFEPDELVDVVYKIANALIPPWAGDEQPGVDDDAAGGAGGADPPAETPPS